MDALHGCIMFGLTCLKLPVAVLQNGT